MLSWLLLSSEVGDQAGFLMKLSYGFLRVKEVLSPMQDNPVRDLEFSPEEWSIIVGFSSSRGTTGNRLGWYASALGPIVILRAYGAWKSDIIAISLAFACLLAYVVWLSVGELRGLQVYQSIFSKIVAFKEMKETSSPPATASGENPPSLSQDGSP